LEGESGVPRYSEPEGGVACREWRWAEEENCKGHPVWHEGVHYEEPQGYREMEVRKASPDCRDMVGELAL
jgi:hypothetical protein